MGWGCAQTLGGQEDRALANLERQGYEAFCPRYVRAGDRRSDPVRLPLFPCYVFIRMDPDTRWTPIRSTRGVVRVLTDRSRDNPSVLLLPDSLIESLGRMGTRDDSGLTPGIVVRVRRRSSPLWGYVGTVVGMPPGQRVRVLMSLFSRDTVVEFDDPSALEVV